MAYFNPSNLPPIPFIDVVIDCTSDTFSKSGGSTDPNNNPVGGAGETRGYLLWVNRA